MKLAEISRGHVRVKNGPKSVTVYGEALVRGYGSPDFILFQNSVQKWDPPNDAEQLTPAEKEQLIQFIKNEFSRRNFLLEVEQ